LGQLKQPLIGIISQTTGSTEKLLANPVNFRSDLKAGGTALEVAPGVLRAQQLGERADGLITGAA
jgi:hypothetical protein